jgi:uncharacterized protein YoxC
MQEVENEMIIILYLSVAVIAIAFFILVIYLVKTLKSLQGTLDSVAHTLDGLEGQLQGVTGETTALLHKTNSLAEDIQHKSEQLNTVVYAVKDVGTTLQNLTGSFKKMSNSVSKEMDRNQDKVAQVVQWSNVLMEIRNKWKSKRTPETSGLPAVQSDQLVERDIVTERVKS